MNGKEMSYNERYTYLIELLDDDKFIQKKYVGAEIPNYICAFPPEDISSYNDMVDNLSKNLTKKGRKVLHLNVYEIMVGMLKDTLLEKIPPLLNRLVPIVVFYPGNYDKVTGSSALQLFGKLEHKNYYRAFNIFTEVR